MSAGAEPRERDLLQKQAKALGDPTRLGIFRFIKGSALPVTVAALTEYAQLNHNAVRQHLAKLVEAHLVQESRVRTGGRGRPRLVYELHPRAVTRWLDENPYERLSVLLAEVNRTGKTPAEVGHRAGTALPQPGADPETAVRDLTAMFADLGFLPEVATRSGGADVVLRNCPFASAVLRDPAVCALHRGLAEGFLFGTQLEVVDLLARDPREAQCVLRLAPARPAESA